MTDQGEHVPTTQEIALYSAMTAGDWDTVDQMRETAYTADQTPPDPVPEDWLSPRDQFDVDYGYAYAHYQSDHEAPEQAREVATKVQVQEENADAGLRMEGM
jgi:hypothetical protein